MSAGEYVRRYFILFWGLVFNALGVVIVTGAELGTSPIASTPYTLSLLIPALTLGNWTILFNFFLIACSALLLWKNAKPLEIVLELVVSVVFGYLVDLFMFLFDFISPSHYVLRLLCVIIGCAVVAFGVYLEVVADVVMLAGDAFVRAIVHRTGGQHGTIRMISDISMVALAAILSLVFMGELKGVREGTIISALITGLFVGLFSRFFRRLTRIMLGKYFF